MGADSRSDLGLGRLRREVAASAASIQRRAIGKRIVRVGGRTLIVLALAFAVLTALPPFAWPIRGRVTSSFFFRQKPDSSAIFDLEFHKGLDIAAPSGTPVHASAPGIVIEAGKSSDLGNFVRIRHLFGLTSTYGHLSRIDVAKGRFILFRGASSIGAVGSTGRSTGPHLHFAFQAGSLRLPPRALLFFHSLRRAILGI
jgi:murein DD-endopeptidase MepM/ murein hydrolase activator NlpD